MKVFEMIQVCVIGPDHLDDLKYPPSDIRFKEYMNHFIMNERDKFETYKLKDFISALNDQYTDIDVDNSIFWIYWDLYDIDMDIKIHNKDQVISSTLEYFEDGIKDLANKHNIKCELHDYITHNTTMS